MKRIISTRRLAEILGVRIERLRAIAANPSKHYRVWLERDQKNPAIFREIKSPHPELKIIQTAITRLILATKLEPHVHGGIKGRSPLTNALVHVGKAFVITIDVRQFFPSIKHTMVYQMLVEEFGCGRDVASLLTKLTTLDGSVPQGAPTSMAIANLYVAAVDRVLKDAADGKACDLTRFVDDVAASGNRPHDLINVVARAFSTRGLRIHRKRPPWVKQKLKVMPRYHRQEVTGLVVNGTRPTVARYKRDKVRTAIFQLRAISDEKQCHKVATSVRARIAYIRPFNPGAAARLERGLVRALS